MATNTSQISVLSVVTFRVSCRWREMYIGHVHLYVSVCLHLSTATFPYCMDSDVTWGNGRGCP